MNSLIIASAITDRGHKDDWEDSTRKCRKKADDIKNITQPQAG